MGKHEELTPRQKKRLDEFIREVFYLTEQESAAIDCQIPMTQELFEQCIEHCAQIDAQFALNDLIIRYPKFSAEYTKKIEDASDIALTEEEMAERKKIIWQKICARIKV